MISSTFSEYFPVLSRYFLLINLLQMNKLNTSNCVREAGLEPARPKTQVPKTCVSAISPLPQTHD